ncbi:MAG: hypothetical protein KA500_01735 [Rhodoluna sp.]|nr:hypothetical protein [Rhodoluna sp.]MBP6186231.1 hypothetical protein [Rhodoluna sp.]
MFNISTASPLEVLLAVCFVFIAVGLLLATFAVGLAFVFSNIKERWHEYSRQKKLKVVSNVVVTAAVTAILITLSTIRLS